jgi:hypothetical protein
MNWSRRGFLALLASPCFSASLPGERAQIRKYRVDVLVSFMGLPIFSRKAAGSASACIRESMEGRERRIALSFSGGADPSRTHGVDYAGSAEETALERDSELKEAATFGWVTTTSSDESFQQAKHRFLNGMRNERYVVVDEIHREGRIRLRKANVPGPRNDVRANFWAADAAEREIAAGSASGAVPTFLYTVLSAIRTEQRRSCYEYVHNGKQYSLTCERNGARLTGQIRDAETKHTSSFHLWVEEGSELPARIEFSPRSYLRITLEKEEM